MDKIPAATGAEELIRDKARRDGAGYYQRLAKNLLKDVAAHGFRNAMMVRLDGHAIDFVHFLSMPSKAVKHYFAKRCEGIDPVLKHALGATFPFFWDELDEMGHFTPAEQRFVDTMRQHGVMSGLTLPLSPLGGRLAFMSLSARSQQKPDWEAVGPLLFVCNAYHTAWHAGLRVEQPDIVYWPTPKLTPRQIECLRGCYEGLSSVQIGQRIGVCENTVQFHVSNTMQQLGVNNRTTAVLRAFELGIL